MKIVLTGPKCSGKSTIGGRLAEILGLPFIETDSHLEDRYCAETGDRRSCREICADEGEASFRAREADAAADIAARDWCVVATGGGTMLDPETRSLLVSGSMLVLIKAPVHLLWERMQKTGLPPFLRCADGLSEYQERVRRLYEATAHLADIVFTVTSENEGEAHLLLADRIAEATLRRMRSPSSFGEVVRVTTFGESHGPAVGAVLDGVPPMVEISEADIQRELDRRRPGQSAVTTPRSEEDRAHILSGVFEGRTTGAPICVLVYNRDQDPSKYEAIREVFRPGHADFTFWKKYGIRDHRGGGRSSGRETAGRVAAGAVARKILAERGITITAFAQEIAGVRGEVEDLDFIERNPVRAADPAAAGLMEEAVLRARADKDSVGGVVKLIARGGARGAGRSGLFQDGCPAGDGDLLDRRGERRRDRFGFRRGADAREREQRSHARRRVSFEQRRRDPRGHNDRGRHHAACGGQTDAVHIPRTGDDRYPRRRPDRGRGGKARPVYRAPHSARGGGHGGARAARRARNTE